MVKSSQIRIAVDMMLVLLEILLMKLTIVSINCDIDSCLYVRIYQIV
jgi:hypothetical protein